jgi:hypothetical protein
MHFSPLFSPTLNETFRSFRDRIKKSEDSGLQESLGQAEKIFSELESAKRVGSRAKSHAQVIQVER